MKAIAPLTFVLLSLVCTASYSQVDSDPISYLNHINSQYEELMKDTWQYTRTIAHSRNAQKVEKKRTDLMSTMLSAKRNVGDLPPFNTDVALRDSIVAYLDLTYNILADDYGDILLLEEVSEESYENMKAYLSAQERATEKMEKAADQVDRQHHLFAEKYDVELEERNDKLSQKLDISREVFAYYNKVYLVQFRANLVETLLIKSLIDKNLDDIEKYRTQLLDASETGLQELAEIGYFKGNSSLNQSCLRILSFYKEEAETRIPVIRDFYKSEKEYNDLASSLQEKNNRDITQADINNYNKATAEFKRELTKFNTTQNLLNTKRESTMNSWNNTVEAFMERYIPKH